MSSGRAAGEGDTAAVAMLVDVGRIVRVLPDEPGINKTFDYILPNKLAGAASVMLGSIVRFPLHGRQMRGWVTGVDVTASTDVGKLKHLTKVTGYGPPRELLALSKWAAHRWWGRPASLLRTASPTRSVLSLPAPAVLDERLLPPFDGGDVAAVARVALVAGGASQVRVPPAADLAPLLVECARFGGSRGALVIAPSFDMAVGYARRLRRFGVPVALMPDDWARAAAGGSVVIGTRATTWAPIASPGVVVVLDEHDDGHQQEQMPTWNARDVAIERAKRLGVPALLVSPIGSVACAELPVFSCARGFEREHWAEVTVIDRANAEPWKQGLLSDELGPILRSDATIVCVLNRKGRASLLVCAGCAELSRCERCGGAHTQSDADVLVCSRCQAEQPQVCGHCGRASFKNVRMGVTRAREEIEALAQRPVMELTGDTADSGSELAFWSASIVVGTEAALHRVPRADIVVFLDFDSELFAPRFRAGEQAYALLARAARLVGGGRGGSSGSSGSIGGGSKGASVRPRVVVQTRDPEHPVLRAAVLADPRRYVEEELAKRAELQLPPYTALAEVSGAGVPEIHEQLRALSLSSNRVARAGAGGPTQVAEAGAVSAGGLSAGAASAGAVSAGAASVGGVQIAAEPDGRLLVRAASADALADALASCARPVARVRVEVDPLRA